MVRSFVLKEKCMFMKNSALYPINNYDYVYLSLGQENDTKDEMEPPQNSVMDIIISANKGNFLSLEIFVFSSVNLHVKAVVCEYRL